ncbi:leukotriene-B(4) omega-hydroxylase 2-like [Empidonax traillii]|uniref:leukotriene-B(4) omega-hydroxylase 2-like n=1 Tax=Empidonax traillii TaxID=164674 RepID=UPI000FFD452A|nr:leukotriene-B(4) omega-hydroxylase 2-like [Empidonax traillii]
MAVAAALGPLGAVALGTLTLSLLLRWLWDAVVAVARFRATCRQLNRFPLPPWRNWLLGHTGMAGSTEKDLQAVDALVARYSPGCLWWGLPWLPVLRLFHPSTLRPLLSASAFVAPKDGFSYGFLKPWLGEGLLLSGGHRWVRHRHLLNPAFHGDVIRGYTGIFNQSTHVLLVRAPRCTPRSALHPQTLSCTPKPCPAPPNLPCTSNLPCIPNPTGGPRWPGGSHHPLSQDEDGNTLSDEDIAAEADTFMFEGHDTTASGLAWLFYNLAGHPEYQERCRQEVREILAGRDSEDIEWEDLSRLPFTTMCIKESLRLHPPVTAVSRRCTQDVALRDGRVIPKGVICLMSIYGTHHNPELWPDPEVYNPLRFSPENTKGRSPTSFIPFSAGPRNCIGQSFAMAEMKVVTALTLSRFSLRRDPARPPPRRKPELILRAEDGLWLLLEPLPRGTA